MKIEIAAGISVPPGHDDDDDIQGANILLGITRRKDERLRNKKVL